MLDCLGVVLIEDASDNSFCGYDYELGNAYFRPICLMYGKEDPWVKPLWGLQVKRQVPEASYYQISPAGHCPHDEVPEVYNTIPH